MPDGIPAPGPARVLRSPRARIIGSLFTVLLVAMVSLMVYAMIPFRTHNARTSVTPSAGTPGNVSIAATGTGTQPGTAPPVSASMSAGASATGTPQAKSTTPSAGRARAPAGAGDRKSGGGQDRVVGHQPLTTAGTGPGRRLFVG